MTDHYVTDGKHLLSTTQRGIAALEALGHAWLREDQFATFPTASGDTPTSFEGCGGRWPCVTWCETNAALLDAGQTCPHGDPTCPCPDGDLCHHEDGPGSPGWPKPVVGDDKADSEEGEQRERMGINHVKG